MLERMSQTESPGLNVDLHGSLLDCALKLALESKLAAPQEKAEN